jgi:hypothetical protein
MSNVFYLQDSGFYVELDILDENGNTFPIADATTKKICFVKPNDSENYVDADFVTNGSDGKIRYLIPAGFLDTVGRWKVFAKVISNTYNRYSSKSWFEVKAR